jgi:hypothetical protein
MLHQEIKQNGFDNKISFAKMLHHTLTYYTVLAAEDQECWRMTIELDYMDNKV